MTEKNKLEKGKIVLPRWVDLPELELYMDQVTGLLDKFLSFMKHDDDKKEKVVTPSIINNYVKQNIIPAPVRKKYGREHLACLVIICTLKQIMPLTNIKSMIDGLRTTMSLEELYNCYCSDFETAIDASFKSVIKNNAGCIPVEIAMKMSIQATAGKLVADDILKV